MANSSDQRKFLFDSETGKQYPIGGFLGSELPSPSTNTSRRHSNVELSPSVDLRKLMPPIKEQGNMNSSIPNVLADAYEFLIMKNIKKRVNVSRLFIYYNGRVLDGLHPLGIIDDGTTISAAIEGLKTYGCCKEELFPYNPVNVNKKPPEQCYQEAMKHRIKDVETLNLNLSDMKACLAEGYPFTFGLQTFQSFIDAGKNDGRVPMPKFPYEQQNSHYAWHAMLAVGYKDASKCFIVRNSWGATWGDHGYCYIPYEYMTQPTLCKELYAIKTIDSRDDVNHRGRTNGGDYRRITNEVDSYDRHVDRDRRYHISPDDRYPESDRRSPRRRTDNSNYSDNTTHRKDNRRSVSPPNYEDKRLSILWIDKKSSESTRIGIQLNSGRDAKIDYGETFADAEEYLLRNKHTITRAGSKFLIICRGYYKEENRNPLDLLEYLQRHGLNRVPVIVFTQDKTGLISHLQGQASSMRIYDWQQRLFITNNSEELIRNVKEKTDDSRRDYYR